MRALQIIDVGAPLVEVEIPDPSPGPGEVLLRVSAAGICRSDVHYRSGSRSIPATPLVPGHEVAGTVIEAGAGVSTPTVGSEVCLHYLTTCGACAFCHRGQEQFCIAGGMLGFNRQGGYAEQIVVPARNAFEVPPGIDMSVAAVMMCSSATAFHALRKGRVALGDSVAVFGAGGLGMSALRLARVFGASKVFAVDINPVKLKVAEAHGAIPVPGGPGAVETILDLSDGGVDVAIELVGLSPLMRDAVAVLQPMGRAVAVGITDEEFGLDPFRDLVVREAEIIGSADHLADEISQLLSLVDRGILDLSDVVTNRVALEATAVNEAMDRLEGFGDDVRTVITR